MNNKDIALNEVKEFIKQEEQLNNHKEKDNLMEIDENLPRGKMNTVFNIFLVIVGIIGGISGLISSLIDLVSWHVVIKLIIFVLCGEIVL